MDFEKLAVTGERSWAPRCRAPRADRKDLAARPKSSGCPLPNAGHSGVLLRWAKPVIMRQNVNEWIDAQDRGFGDQRTRETSIAASAGGVPGN